MAKRKQRVSERATEAAFVAHAPASSQHSKGRFHNLQEILDDLNLRHFGGCIKASIEWAKHPKRPRRKHKSIKYGCYVMEDKRIRIHFALDRASVPRFFLEYIVFHEMLHEHLPPRQKNGRMSFHFAEYVAAERAFPGYQQAVAWEKINLDRLLYN